MKRNQKTVNTRATILDHGELDSRIRHNWHWTFLKPALAQFYGRQATQSVRNFSPASTFL
jgi:hypothetical protein